MWNTADSSFQLLVQQKTNISTTIPGMTGHTMAKDSQATQEAIELNEQYIGLIKG